MDITAIIGLVSTIIGRVFPDAQEAKKLEFAKELQLALLQSNIDVEQLKVNAIEAGNDNMFVAGWRPFIGWVCASAFAWQYLLAPIFIFVVALFGGQPPVLPELGLDTMMPVLMGILGLGGLRTFEKVQRIKGK